MDLQLSGDTVAVFGAASGIGRAIARAFLAEGAQVAWFDRDERVEVEAREFSPRSIAGIVDVADYAAVQAARDWASAELGPLRHVVFAVGIGSGKVGFPFWNLEPSDWPSVLEVNLIGAVNVAHAFAPHLAEQREGTITFLTSVAGQIGSQTDPPYSAAKAGLINFMQVAAKDLAPLGVRVNAISPGMVQTPLNERVWQAWNDSQAPEAKLSYAAWAETKISKIAPLGRWQTAEEVAAVAVFLASPWGRNITGQTINVDGGQVMHS